MESVPVFVGVDYHSRSVQVCVMDQSGKVLRNRRGASEIGAVAGAIEPGWAVRRVAIESCCGTAEFADELAAASGWPVTLAHPGFVARMKTNVDKTDYADAKMLAELCRVGLVPPVWLAPRRIRELRLLVRLRADLVGRGRAVKTRILAVLRLQRVAEPARPDGKKITRWTKSWMAWLARDAPLTEQGRFVVETHLGELAGLVERVASVEERLGAATAGDPVVAALRRLKGVGDVTAWTMRALIGDFGRFTSGKQLARFCAVTPRNASSGERVADSGMVRAGDPLLKTVVIEAAQRLARYEPRWKEMAERLAARGKPKSAIIGAIANRWMRWFYHQVKGTIDTTARGAA